jgi:hypothetical protein
MTIHSPLPPACAPEIGEVETAITESPKTELPRLDCHRMLVMGDDTNKV